MNSRIWRPAAASALLAAAGLIVCGSVGRAQTQAPPEPVPYTTPALIAPSAGIPVPPEPSPRMDDTPAVSPALHEAFLPPFAVVDRQDSPKSPPTPKVESPTDDRPSPRAVWVPGYWDWESERGDYEWLPGGWVVPPRNRFWVEGRWMRDADGWYRVPGSWSERQAGGPQTTPPMVPALALAPAPALESNWQIDGPPADREDRPGQAPAADYFYVAGHYAPEGDVLNWSAGFWAKLQPGWDWVPSRWLRRPDGWAYREGNWTRNTETAIAPVRRTAARPALETPAADLPPAIVDSIPGPEVVNRGPARGPWTPGAAPVFDPSVKRQTALGAAGSPNPAAPPIYNPLDTRVNGPVVVRPLVPVPPGNPYPQPPPRNNRRRQRRPNNRPRAAIPNDFMPPFVQRMFDRVVP